MSQENVEVVRRGIEAWNRRDVTTWMASFHPDAEIDWSRSRGPLKGVYRDHGEHETFWDEFWSMFEENLRRTASRRRAPRSWSRTPPTFRGARGSK